MDSRNTRFIRRVGLALIISVFLILAVNISTSVATEKNGLVQEGDYLFYYEDGVRYKGGIKTVDGYTYYFNKNSGAAQSGYIPPNLADGKAYYFDETTFRMRTGLITVSFSTSSNVNTYYFLEEGDVHKGFLNLDGKRFYFDTNHGIMLYGYQMIDGEYYLFDTETGEQVLGLVKADDGNTYYFTENGAHKGFMTIDERVHYFEPSYGIMLLGTQVIDGKYYQFDRDTGAQITGVAQADNGQTYLYLPEGGRGESGVVSLDGDLYYCLPSQSGAVQFGLQSDTEGNLYFFDYKTGKAWRNKTLLLNHIIYTIGEDAIVSDISIEPGYENSTRTRLIKEGLKYLGTPYSLDPNEGFACGYFTKIAYGDVGIQMLAGSDVQCKAIVDGEYGEIIDESELRVGDMVFWTWTDCGENPCTHWENVHHVGIYMGYGKILEANETFGCTAVLHYHEFDTYYMSHFGRVIFDDEDPYVDEKHDALRPYKFECSYDESASAIQLSYDCYVEVDGFEIYKSEDGVDYTLLAEVNGDTKSFTDSSVSVGKNYSYRVRSKRLDSDGTAIYSDFQIEDDIAVQIPDPTPMPVEGLTAVNSGKNRVTLSWDSVPDAEGYLVYGKRASTGQYGYIGMTTKGTTYTDTNALDTDFNFYWVYPYVKYNGKMVVGTCTGYTYAKGITTAATGITAIGAGKGVVQIKWNPVDGADGYLIYGRRSKNGTYGYIGMTTKGTTYSDTKALDTDFNFYWVFPYHETNGKKIVGSTPQYVYAKGITGPVTKANGLAASSISGGVKISWKGVKDAAGYIIYAKRPGASGFSYIGMTTKNLYYTDTKATKDDWTFYRVFSFHYGADNVLVAGESGDYVYGKAK